MDWKEHLKDHITNEELGKKFNSQFELVNYAMKLAENMILTGRRALPYGSPDALNPATAAIIEIATGTDRFDEIIDDDDEEDNRYMDNPRPKKNNDDVDGGKKKSRKILVG